MVVDILSLRFPVPPARLQQPQARDVLQQSRRAADAALIREIQRLRPRADDRLAQLRAEQRPGARAEERGAAGCRHRRHGGRRVVAGGGPPPCAPPTPPPPPPPAAPPCSPFRLPAHPP